MERFDSIGSFLRVLTVFFVYSVAVQASEAVVESLYLRAGVALLVTLLTVLAIDDDDVAVLVGALGSAMLVFGGLVAYYWRRQSRAMQA